MEIRIPLGRTVPRVDLRSTREGGPGDPASSFYEAEFDEGLADDLRERPDAFSCEPRVADGRR